MLTIYREWSEDKDDLRTRRRCSATAARAGRSVTRVPSPLDRYGSDVLADDWRTPKNGRAVEVDADLGLVVEEVTTDWCGEIVKVERDLGTLTLEDRRNKRRTFPLGPGFLLEGRPVVLVAPTRKGPQAPTRTASGSVAVQGVKAHDTHS